MTDPETGVEARPAAGAHPHPTPHPDARPSRKPRPLPKAAPAPSIPDVLTPADTAAETTRSFTKADIAALREALAADRRRADGRRNAVPKTPNLGLGLVIFLTVSVVVLVALAALICWLVLGQPPTYSGYYWS